MTPGDVVPTMYSTHQDNKQFLLGILKSLASLETSLERLASEEALQKADGVSVLKSQLSDFALKYKAEIEDLHSQIEGGKEKNDELRETIFNQNITIRQLTEESLEEQVKRHRAVQYLKSVTRNDRQVTIVEDPNENFTDAEKEIIIEKKFDEEMAAQSEKLEKRLKNNIENLKFKLSVSQKQLEVEEAKVRELTALLSEMHKKEQTRTASDSLEKEQQRSLLMSRQSSAPLMKTIGGNSDLFEEMFGEPKLVRVASQVRASGFVSSALGNLKIDTVFRDGSFIRIRNSDPEKDEEIGQYVIQQKLNGATVAAFRFPSKAKLRAGQSVNVWAAGCPMARSAPPSDYIWKEQLRCGYGPDIVTVLSKPGRRAVAWHAGEHKYSGQIEEFNDEDTMRKQARMVPHVGKQVAGEEPAIRREKTLPATLHDNPTKHPHGSHSQIITHPSVDQLREKTWGNDQTSLMRQMRQPRTPDAVPELYAGAARTGAKILLSGNRLTPAALHQQCQSPGFIRKMATVGVTN